MVSFCAVLTAALALGVAAAPSGLSPRADPDAVLPQTWTVQAFPDGPLLTLTGSLSNVHDQLVALNPDFDIDFPSFQAEVNAMMSGHLIVQEQDVTVVDKKQMKKRDDLPTTWQVQAFLDGPILSLNGTVEELHSQLVALNPNFDEDFPTFYNEIALMQWMKQLGVSDDDLLSDDSKRKMKRALPSEWRVRAVPHGPLVVLSGTIDDVHAQLLALNPDFDTDFSTFWTQIEALRYLDHLDDEDADELKMMRDVDTEHYTKEMRRSYSHNQDILDATNEFKDVKAVCSKDKLTFISYVQTGVDYLRGLRTAAPENAAHSCGRISCIYDSAIHWCNNNDASLTLSNWTVLANAADSLLQQCTSNNVPYGYLGGNITHPTDNWTLRVGFERC